MKNKLFFLSAIAATFVFQSCSSTADKIQGNWWYAVEDKGDVIIQFTEGGKIKSINDKEELEYKIEDETITIQVRDSEKERAELQKIIIEKSQDTLNTQPPAEPQKYYKEEKWTVTKVSDDELVIQNGNETRTFRPAKNEDFLIGSWDNKIGDEEFKYKFNKKNEMRIRKRFQITSDEMNFTLSDGKVSFNNETFDISLSEDKNTITLKGPKEITLTRDPS